MPKRLKPQEKERRIKLGRRIRFMMEERGIGYAFLMKRLQNKDGKRVSRHAIYLALWTEQLPDLRGRIHDLVRGVSLSKVQ